MVYGGAVRNSIERNSVRIIGDSDVVDDATWDGETWTESADVSTQYLCVMDNGGNKNEEVCERPPTVGILVVNSCEYGLNHSNVR